ncbi:MAG: hypothetical protein O9275_08630, partial [Microcystis sp. LE19-196.1B]|nr:hypothetical protein [Microcystis sp. LE19-196.1B]
MNRQCPRHRIPGFFHCQIDGSRYLAIPGNCWVNSPLTNHPRTRINLSNKAVRSSLVIDLGGGCLVGVIGVTGVSIQPSPISRNIPTIHCP